MARVPARLRRTMRAIPDYDPFRSAGDCRVDVDEAQRALDFFAECLQFIEGERAGEPFALERWQQAIVANLFGWKRPDGTRRYREAFIFVAKKNGKTPLCAGIALYLLACDGESGPQVYSAAADRDQAALVYRHAAEMAQREPELASRLRIYRTFKTIECPGNGGIYRALSSEHGTKHGLNIHGLIVDELHAHPSPDLVETLMTGTASRRQPLVVHITTSDFERESICNRKYDYAVKVRDGVLEDQAFLPVIYEASADDDWTKVKTWRKANPNLGVSVSRDYLERECRRAQAEASYLNTFLRLHLNIRTHAHIAAFDMRLWEASGGELEPEDLIGARCHGGLDLASTIDLSSWALYFPDYGAALIWFWIPKETALRAQERDRVPYTAWAREGHVRYTPGSGVDYAQIEDDVVASIERYNFVDAGYDDWNAEHVAQDLRDRGLEMVKFIQGKKSYNEPCKELERLVATGGLEHFGHPVLRWCASNVMWEQDHQGNIMPSRKSSKGKIDGICALAMAIGRSVVTEGPVESVYSKRGPLVV